MKNLWKLIAMLTLVFLTSCEKENQTNDPSFGEVPTNPFNEVGELHNKILDDVIALPNVIEMDKSEIMNFILEKVQEVYPNTSYEIIPNSESAVKEYFEEPYEMLLSEGAITETEYSYLKKIEKAWCCPIDFLEELDKILREILNPTGPFNPLLSPQNYNNNGELEEGSIVLLTEAVARNSFMYWKKQAEDPNSKWKEYETAKVQLAGPWENIGGADAAGAGGALAATWWSGPFSLGPVVVTAVGASVGMGLWELGSYLFG